MPASILYGNVISAGPVFDVRYYGAKGDGVSDDLGPIQAALAAIYAAGGGTLYLAKPPVAYAVSGTIVVGNATTTTRSVPVSVVGDGGLLDPGPGGGTAASVTAQLNALRAPTTIIPLPGFAGSTLMILQGPGDFERVSDFMLNCMGLCPNGLITYAASNMMISRVQIMQWNGSVGYWVLTSTTWTGTWGDEIHNVVHTSIHAISTYANSTACSIGQGTTAQSVNISLQTFVRCVFNVFAYGVPAPSNGTGLELRDCDSLTFIDLVTEGTAAGIKINPPTGAQGASFPGALMFTNLIVAGGWIIPSATAWPSLGGGGFIVYNYLTDNSGPPPPWDSRYTFFLEGGLLWGNGRIAESYIALTGGGSVTNTTTETALPLISGSFAIPQTR